MKSKIQHENGKISFEFPYFQCPNEIFDKKIEIYDYVSHTERPIDCQEKLILIYLFRCCNNGKSAFPSYSIIADKCGCSKRKAMYAIDNLFRNNFIKKKSRGFLPQNEGQVTKNFSNSYVINHEKLKNSV